MEAFKGRGKNDGRVSQDFEDIVFILDNRKDIWTEMKDTTKSLRGYLKSEFSDMLDNLFIEEWLSAHLEYNTATVRARLIISAMKKFVL